MFSLFWKCVDHNAHFNTKIKLKLFWLCNEDSNFLFTFFQQIREEFYRITNKNLMENFKEALHQHTWRLLRLYRARRTAFLSKMDQLLNSLDQEVNSRCSNLITMHIMDRFRVRVTLLWQTLRINAWVSKGHNSTNKWTNDDQMINDQRPKITQI